MDVRLGMLALLETMLRAGAADWECGPQMSANCNNLLEKALVPNLVWRVGIFESKISSFRAYNTVLLYVGWPCRRGG